MLERGRVTFVLLVIVAVLVFGTTLGRSVVSRGLGNFAFLGLAGRMPAGWDVSHYEALQSVFASANELDPLSGQASIGHGRSLMTLREDEQAAKVLDTADRSSSPDVVAELLHASSLSMSGRWQESADLTRQLLEEVGEIDWLERLARAREDLASGELRLAMLLYGEAIALNPSMAASIVHEIDRAEEMTQRHRIAQNGDDVEARYRLAVVLERQGGPEASLREFDQLCARKDLFGQLSAGQLAVVSQRCGLISERCGDLATAEAAYRQAIMLDPLLARAYASLTELYRHQQREEEAASLEDLLGRIRPTIEIGQAVGDRDLRGLHVVDGAVAGGAGATDVLLFWSNHPPETEILGSQVYRWKGSEAWIEERRVLDLMANGGFELGMDEAGLPLGFGALRSNDAVDLQAAQRLVVGEKGEQSLSLMGTAAEPMQRALCTRAVGLGRGAAYVLGGSTRINDEGRATIGCLQSGVQSGSDPWALAASSEGLTDWYSHGALVQGSDAGSCRVCVANGASEGTAEFDGLFLLEVMERSHGTAGWGDIRLRLAAEEDTILGRQLCSGPPPTGIIENPVGAVLARQGAQGMRFGVELTEDPALEPWLRWVGEARAAVARADYGVAMAWYEALVDLYRRSGEAHPREWSLPGQELELVAALQRSDQLRVALETGSGDISQRYELGLLLERVGLTAEALGEFAALCEAESTLSGLSDAKQAIVSQRCGLVYEAEGDADAAEAAYLRAIDIDPFQLAAYSRLLQLLRDQGREAEAEALIAEVERLEPRISIGEPMGDRVLLGIHVVDWPEVGKARSLEVLLFWRSDDRPDPFTVEKSEYYSESSLSWIERKRLADFMINGSFDLGLNESGLPTGFSPLYAEGSEYLAQVPPSLVDVGGNAVLVLGKGAPDPLDGTLCSDSIQLFPEGIYLLGGLIRTSDGGLAVLGCLRSGMAVGEDPWRLAANGVQNGGWASYGTAIDGASAESCRVCMLNYANVGTTTFDFLFLLGLRETQ